MGTLFPTAVWLMLSCLLLVAPQPGASWYKHSSSPRYHTVGRASGLLIGVRRSPYLWRRNLRGDIQPDSLEGHLWGTHEQEESDSSRLLYPDPEDIGKMQERSPLIVQSNLEGLLEEASERQKSVGEEMRLGGAEKNLNPNESSRRFQGKWEMKRSTEDGSLQEPRPRTEVQAEQKLTRWSPWQLEMNQQEHHLNGGRRSLQNQWQVRRNTGGEMGLQEPRQLKRTPEEIKINMLDPCQADRNPEWHIFTELQNRLRLYLPKEERTLCISQQRSSRSTRNPQIPQESARTPESFSCEDYTWDSLKMLCKANVSFWSRSLLGARKQTTEIEEPAASI